MRSSILLVIAWLLWPALALARPKVAVAPLDGDADGKISAIVHAAAAEHADVTSSRVVAKALRELEIADPDNARAAKKLRKHLAVDGVIYGKIERDGAKTRLTVSVYTRGKKPDRFQFEYRSSSAKGFRKKISDELASRLAPDDNGNDDEDAKPPPTRTIANSTEGDVDAEPKPVHKHARHAKASDGDAQPEAERDLLTQGAVFVDAGLGGVHRTLTYAASAGGTKPPRVGTGAFAIQLDGEIYPGAFDSTDGIAASLGLYASLNKALGLSIAIPGTTASAPISETSFALGARYRFVFGRSSVALGLAYWSQSFVANRSSLTSPGQLDMPDTTYKAVAPDALLRLAIVPAVSATLQVDVPLMLSSGPITDSTYFGAGSVTSIAVQVGADVALGRHYALHFAGFLNQESLSFKAGMVSSATDRTTGASVAFALVY